MQTLKIGTAKGPGENPHEFLFITPDDNGHCKIGEFVYYILEDVEGQRAVLGRIVQRAAVRLFPDSFMASPDVRPQEVASAIGYADDQSELFEVSVAVMGYFDPGLGAFVNPRALPRSGAVIYLTPSDMLAEVLSKRKLHQAGSAHVGSLLSRRAGEVPVVLDVNELASTHLSIIAGTGAGKSYLAGVTIEELMKPYNKGCVLVVDPHGEYDTLMDMQNDDQFVDGQYRPRVRVYKPNQVKVRMSTLTIDDLRYLMPTLGERMEAILTDAFNRMKRAKRDQYEDHWTLTDLYNAIDDVGQEKSDQGIDYGSSIQGLRWRLQRRFEHNETFHPTQHLDLNQLFRPGQCTVLQLNEVDQQDQQVVVATLLRRLLRARMDTERGKASEGDESHLPYPVFVLVEEAHHFAPASADVISSGVLKQILSEGRKFGVGVGLISQRPGKLDADVLSQCMTHFIMRIVNPIDQNSIASAVESVGRDLLDELPALTKGQVVIAGSALNTPVISQTRARHTRHGGTSVDAVAEWDSFFRGEDERQRDSGVVEFRASRNKVFRTEN